MKFLLNISFIISPMHKDEIYMPFITRLEKFLDLEKVNFLCSGCPSLVILLNLAKCSLLTLKFFSTLFFLISCFIKSVFHIQI